MSAKLTFKEAAGETKQMIRTLRAFERVEEVLATASEAQRALKGLEVRIEELAVSETALAGKVEVVRAQYTSEQIAAATEMERLAAAARDQSAKQLRDKEEALDKTQRQIEEAQRAGERAKRALTDECKELEERVMELTKKLKWAGDEYEAFRQKVGVS